MRQLQAEALERLRDLPGAARLYVVEPATRFWQFGDHRFGEQDERWRVVNELDCCVVRDISNPRTGGPSTAFVPSPALLLETGKVVQLGADDHVRCRVPNSFAVSALHGATLEWMDRFSYSNAALDDAKNALARVVVMHETNTQQRTRPAT